MVDERILVTGGVGFIGSHLVERLIEAGESVVVIDRESPGGRDVIPYREESRSSARYVIADIADGIRNVEGLENVEVVFHLAAESRIQPSFNRPLKTFRSNAMGTANVLEFVRQRECRMVYAGSSTADYDPCVNPYAATKRIGEILCETYSKSYGVACNVARFYNVYGEGQQEDGENATVIGVFERQMRNGERLTITGDGSQRRDFTHVSDVVSGLIAMSGRMSLWCQCNLGSGVSHSISEVASMFGEPVEHLPARPGEAPCTLADINPTKSLLGWNPQVRLGEYIQGLK